MKIDDFLFLSELLLQEARELLKTKNDDYSKGDAFGAFKKCAKINKILELNESDKKDRALSAIVTKLVRLKSLGDRKAKHESVKDSCVDGINFFTLYYGMWWEEWTNKHGFKKPE